MADWISISCPIGLVTTEAIDLVLGLVAPVWAHAAADCCLSSCTVLVSCLPMIFFATAQDCKILSIYSYQHPGNDPCSYPLDLLTLYVFGTIFH
jgi:hypothetical protein